MKTVLLKFGKWVLKNAGSIIELILTGKTSKPLVKKEEPKSDYEIQFAEYKKSTKKTIKKI